MLLYILPAPDFNFFKIGISEKHNRVFFLNTVYPISLERAIAIEMEDAELIKSIETYLLKLTASHTCKKVYVRPTYKGKTYPGVTELRDYEAIPMVLLSLLQMMELHGDKIKTLKFFYYRCPHCDVLHEKSEYFTYEDIQSQIEHVKNYINMQRNSLTA